MATENEAKNKHGNSSKNNLAYILDFAKEIGYIKRIVLGYKLGMEGYADCMQFKAPFMIVFDDDTEWILYTTTSIRERVQEQYWNAEHLKNIDPAIKCAYLVYPDSISTKEKKIAVAKNNKIQNRIEYSTLEGIISQDRVFNLIEDYALRNKTPGQIRDIKGNNFEKRLAATLSNPWNLEKWKTNEATLEGMHYGVFCSLLNTFELNPATVVNISATSNKTEIGLLPSGGPAKTDVYVEVDLDNGETLYYTISCKRSSATSVSVHQYSADSFADVLDFENTELRRLLNLFQSFGAVQDRNGNRYISEEDETALTEALEPYVQKLTEWVIGGRHGDGDPIKQWANYIVIYDNNDGSTSIHTVDDYCTMLMSSDTNGKFGTPFTWTYQGTRGTNIQLKSKIFK